MKITDFIDTYFLIGDISEEVYFTTNNANLFFNDSILKSNIFNNQLNERCTFNLNKTVNIPSFKIEKEFYKNSFLDLVNRQIKLETNFIHNQKIWSLIIPITIQDFSTMDSNDTNTINITNVEIIINGKVIIKKKEGAN